MGSRMSHPTSHAPTCEIAKQIFLLGLLLLAFLHPIPPVLGEGTRPPFRIATFNVENYLVRPAPGRAPKTESGRQAVARHLAALQPDVVALQEIGDAEALKDLQARLRALGVELGEHEIVRGHDTNIHVAVLSRFPFVERHPHERETYLLDGRRMRVSRGFAQVTFAPCPGYEVTLLVAHLKSKRGVGAALESSMREHEARLLREKVDVILEARLDANVVVCGDFNDSMESPALRLVMGRGPRGLVDTRPGERGPAAPPGPSGQRCVTWTHHFAREDAYTRIDYILLSRGMAREWRRQGTFVQAVPDWGVASDHRPLVAEFEEGER